MDTQIYAKALICCLIKYEHLIEKQQDRKYAAEILAAFYKAVSF